VKVTARVALTAPAARAALMESPEVAEVAAVLVTAVEAAIVTAGTDGEPVGLVVIAAVKVAVSVVAAVAVKPATDVVLATVSISTVCVAVVVRVRADTVADAGATDVSTPKPNAATKTSEIRLKVVFVDICFLSISRGFGRSESRLEPDCSDSFR